MKKCVIFNDIFPRLSRTKMIFQDCPAPGIFKNKIQGFPGGVGTLHKSTISTCSHICFNTLSSQRAAAQVI